MHQIVENSDRENNLAMPNPHMLRHGCGFYIINNGWDVRAVQIYLGHASISNTVIYTRLSEKQFVGMWEQAPL